MGAAVGADCFGADHAVAGVGVAGDFAFGYLLPEAGPACAGVVFGVAGEQLLVAHYAVVGAVGVAVPVFAAERPLGAGVLGYLVLQRGEAVFQVGWLVGHGVLLSGQMSSRKENCLSGLVVSPQFSTTELTSAHGWVKLTVAFWDFVDTSNYKGQFICNPK